MFKQALIHYFTGTGNTVHVAKQISKQLKENNTSVTIYNIENELMYSLEDYDLHIILFPVYGFGIPYIMVKYLKSLQDVINSKAAIISVGGHTGRLEGDEGQSLSHAYKILTHRGFNVFFTHLVSYPVNFTQILNPPKKEAVDRIFKHSDNIVKNIANKISDEVHQI